MFSVEYRGPNREHRQYYLLHTLVSMLAAVAVKATGMLCLRVFRL